MPALGESKEWAFSGFFSFLVVNHQRRSNFDGLSVPWGAPRVISLKTLHPWGLLHHPTRDVKPSVPHQWLARFSTSGGNNSYWTTAGPPHTTNFFRNPINIATFHTHSTMRTRATTMPKRKHYDGEYVAACVLSEISGNSNRKTAQFTGLSHQEVPRIVKRARTRNWSPSDGPLSTKQVHPAHGNG
jgi:hypothetical protein